MAELKDSGNRQTFSTGAVRDIQEGKGRCDLLPLDVMSQYIRFVEIKKSETEVVEMTKENCIGSVLMAIEQFKDTNDTSYLFAAIYVFCKYQHLKYYSFSSMLLELAQHFEDGAKKYGDNNWRQGIPTARYIDSATRHYLKYCRGDADEPHDRAFIWNLICCIWTKYKFFGDIMIDSYVSDSTDEDTVAYYADDKRVDLGANDTKKSPSFAK